MLEASKFGNRQWTPHEVFIKVLYEYFRERLTPEDASGGSTLDLATFQQEGLREAIRLLERHSGVLVADAVGLGKTFIGLGLLEHYLISQRRKGNVPRGLVICPAQLRDTVWGPRLQEYQIAATVLSMEEVGRGDFPWRTYRNFDFVLVDESHNFRNPGTSRYRSLFKLLSTGKRTKRLALLTATPINNTIWDLYNQLMLITRGQEDFYRDYGVPNLRGFFARADKGSTDLFDLLEECMVRRSRRDIKRRQEAGERVVIAGRDIVFPERKLGAITYDLDGTYAGFYRSIAEDIDRLTLVSYNIEQFRKGNREQATIDRNNAIIGLLKTMFLKRLESSVAAFETSVRWQSEFQQRFYETLVNHNRLLDSARYRQMSGLLGEQHGADGDASAESFSAEQVLAELPLAKAQEYDLAALKSRLEDDLNILNGLMSKLDRIRQGTESGVLYDDKLEQVKVALSTPPLVGKKVLIFSYYERTAQYLYNSLLADKHWHGKVGKPKLALLTGHTSPSQRKVLIERFAPVANLGLGGVAQQRVGGEKEEELDILVSTDVLSEGQNLQDAGVLLNYDLHWNPVRMIQRAGRIDRVGSPHPELLIYNCFPEDELEQLLGLVGRLQSRIAAIGRSIGNDASILGEVVAEKSLEELRRLRAADRVVLEEIEAEEEEWLSGDEMRLPLVAYLQELGESAVAEIPMGIHSGRGGQEVQGVFFAFKAREHHFWRFYRVERGGIVGPPITDKRRLFKMLHCSREESRIVPQHRIWSYLETATKDVLTELTQQQGARQLRAPMSGLNLRLYNFLYNLRATPLQLSMRMEGEGANSPNGSEGRGLVPESPRLSVTHSGTDTVLINTKSGSALVDYAEEQGLDGTIGRLMAMVQEVPLRPFERDPDFKAILDKYAQDEDILAFVTDLDAFAVEQELYAGLDNTEGARPTLEAIREQDVQLICYELFS
ncbi:MAG: SNF2-related protein [Chloroflexota bacterium]|nr:SNF2-related protein [Chloroflexota bacterium]